jgi:hypothetical protein
MRVRGVLSLWGGACSGGVVCSALRAWCGVLAWVAGCASPAPGADVTDARDVAAMGDAAALDAQPEDAGDTGADAGGADADTADAGTLPACGACGDYGAVRVSGRWQRMVLGEVSGLAASAAHPGIFWAHNDSGDSARVFAVTAEGAIRGEYTAQGAGAVDWEDIAVAPCPGSGRSCVVVADVGDNAVARASVELYRFEEPAVIEAAGTVTVTRFRVRYPMGPMNCEALVVDRRDGARALLLEKTTRAPRLVQVDLSARDGGEASAVELGTIPTFAGALVTGADAHPCAPAMLVRTYDAAYELRAEGDAGAGLEAIARGSRRVVPSANELQGEAIAYLHDGRGYVTATEVQTLISTTRCR